MHEANRSHRLSEVGWKLWRGNNEATGKPSWMSKHIIEVMEAEGSEVAPCPFFQAGCFLWPLRKDTLDLSGNSGWMKSLCFLHSSPNCRMKTDAQLSLGILHAASLFVPHSPCALFLVPDLFSLCFYGFCSSKTGCCLARRAEAWFKP